MSRAYYNEFDPKAAAWLRELINAGHIAPGDVDERSILDVQPSDLTPYAQCHFFAGIGGWSYALRLAGLPDDAPVWTGSCPCQPFSAAGKGLGTKDERHLWPAFARLIQACRPAIAFGEQVASKDGRLWLAGVFADLEALGYSRAAADLCAAGVGGPHIRQRLYWVAYGEGERWKWRQDAAESRGRAFPEDGCFAGRMADSNGGQCRNGGLQCSGQHRQQQEDGCSVWLGDSVREGREGQSLGLVGPSNKADWSYFDFLQCLDGKARRVESGTFPLAHGVPGRVGLLRGYGNAIVPQVAAEFILASLEAQPKGDA